MIGLLVLHAFATFFMTGLIWFVQVVHYPLFDAVGRDSFSAYERSHQRRTTYVVAPLMFLELVTGILLLIPGRLEIGMSVAGGGAFCLFLIWGITAVVQVPQHRALEQKFESEIWRNLVRGNWIRTALWSLRSLIVAQMLLELLPSA